MTLRSPYRTHSLGAPSGLAWRSFDWGGALYCVVAVATGFVAVPALFLRLAIEAHSVLPQLFTGLAFLAGAALSLLAVAVRSRPLD